jgi:hypothetical protein
MLRKRKNETPKEYNARLLAVERFRAWQREHWDEIQADIKTRQDALQDKNGLNHLQRHTHKHYDDPVMHGELIRVVLPRSPRLSRPTPVTTVLHCNDAGLRFLQRHLAGEDVREHRRPADRCMHGRPHSCFYPHGERPWCYVLWRLRLLPSRFPLESMHPPAWQKDHRSRFCCPQAARLFIRELHAQGQRDIRLETDAPDEETRDFVHFLNVTMPCLADG